MLDKIKQQFSNEEWDIIEDSLILYRESDGTYFLYIEEMPIAKSLLVKKIKLPE